MDTAEETDDCHDNSLGASSSKPKKDNMFDTMVTLAPPKSSDLGSKLKHYLCTDVEHVTNAVAWWHKQCAVYPGLSHMALDYLTIPATSINVEHLFSHRALSHLILVKTDNGLAVPALVDVEGDKEALKDGWDSIVL
ncbi:hypothetical protein PAXRUDRAFT_13847 [Paxillus rubicundulus Ve08.2h10]|uniref:HAT C-terminal dimerisation domain-containing protein n=1 Tax=Paxillus rubicundulus Ve08.2h10 TaxID=930991 RepID=A0A0D0D475_9AGAM|nr:hypothetical protein PAXRUDRAFT_13847 [Paxillus rubicundulus Ve08.2h10]